MSNLSDGLAADLAQLRKTGMDLPEDYRGDRMTHPALPEQDEAAFTKGTRVRYTVMYSDGRGHGRAHIEHRPAFGRITSIQTGGSRQELRATIAVENPKPGSARYVERYVKDLQLAPEQVTQDKTPPQPRVVRMIIPGLGADTEAAAWAAFREGVTTWLADEHGPVAAIVPLAVARGARKLADTTPIRPSDQSEHSQAGESDG